MTLAAGELNRKIVISKPNDAVDALNQPLPGRVPVFNLWARPLTATGMAAVRAAEQGVPMAPGKYSWRIRYRPTGITTNMTVEYRGVFFDIRDIRHDYANHEYTDLVCETGVDHG